MLDFAHILLLILILLLLRPHLRRWCKHLSMRWKLVKPRQWKPATPHDCQLCCQHVSVQVVKRHDVVPYPQIKSTRGRKKTVSTQGFACPNPDCDYCGIIDDAIHALVGYGHQLQQVGLRRLIQTAFIEHVNLTFRQSVSPLSRRT